MVRSQSIFYVTEISQILAYSKSNTALTSNGWIGSSEEGLDYSLARWPSSQTRAEGHGGCLAKTRQHQSFILAKCIELDRFMKFELIVVWEVKIGFAIRVAPPQTNGRGCLNRLNLRWESTCYLSQRRGSPSPAVTVIMVYRPFSHAC
jgi:hypothetical protein